MSKPTAQKWDRRPWLAGLVRVIVTVAPIAFSVVTVLGLGRVWQRPEGLVRTIGWWIGLSLVATGVMWVMDKWFRRLLPIGALFKLSLVFPDRAPSRMGVAMRHGTVRQLKRNVESGEFSNAAPQAAAEQLIALAATLNDHDRLTRGHTERVRAYSVMIGEQMGLEGDELELLNWSGLIHDIGKLTVPAEILTKAGKPTDAEWGILRKHPAAADLLVEPLRPWLGLWAESATQHHERFDGKGYPNGIAGHDITLAGRIVAVADAYDVMTSARSYKQPMPADEARKELAANAGTQFDPDVVRAFLTISIGRVRLVMGPLASLFQMPVGNASLGAAASSGVSAAAAMAIAVVAGVSSTPAEVAAPVPEVIALVAPSAVDISINGEEDGTFLVDVAGQTTGAIESIYLIGDPEYGTAVVYPDGTVGFTPDANFYGTTTVDYEACFGAGECDQATLTFVVEPVNDPPLALPDAVEIAEDTTAVVDVLANDSDVDGDAARLESFELLTDPNHQLVPTQASIEDGQIIIEPGLNDWGSTLVLYTITDPSGATSSAELLVTVLPVNDAPIARSDTLTMLSDSTASLDVLGNDSDVDGDVLTIQSVTSASGGLATSNGRTVTFAPNAGFTGLARFNYTIRDVAGETSQASAQITVIKPASKLILSPDAATVPEDGSVFIDVLANDSSSPAAFATSTLRVDSVPAKGTVMRSGGGFQYNPSPDAVGLDSFEYFVCDVDGGCGTASVTLKITAINDAPSFTVGANHTTTEDAGPRTVAGWATSITPGPADESAQSVSFKVTAANPALFSIQPAIAPSGTLTYTPAPNANGTTALTITLTDSGGATSPPQTTVVTITPINDRPVAVADSVAVGEDPADAVAFNAIANDTDLEGDTVVYTSATTSTIVNGVIVDNLNGTFNYTPDEDFNGIETFSYTISDGNGGNATGTVTITVTLVPDAPVAIDDARAVDVDTPLVVSAPGLLANDYDVDVETLTVNATPTVAPLFGTLTLAADGAFLYIPNSGFSGTDTFGYEISDPGGLTAAAMVTVKVASGTVLQAFYFGNNGSSANNYSLTTSPPVSSSPVFDADGDGSPGLSIKADKGKDYETDEATFQTWSQTAAAPLELDGPVTFDLWASNKNFRTDRKGHAYAYLYDCLGSTCTTIAASDLHVAAWNDGVADFVFYQIDLGSVTHTVPAGNDLVVRLQFKHENMWVAMTADYPTNLSITLANQPPVAVDDAATILEDSGSQNIAVLSNDTDLDIDPSSVTITGGAAAGVASPVGDGTINYTPNANANGIDTFTYEVCDLSGACDSATVTVTTTAVNDVPAFIGGGNVAASGFGTKTFAGWASGISAGPPNEAAQALTFTVTGNDAAGLFATQPAVDPATGELTFRASSSGVATITIELGDDGGTANGGVNTSTSFTFTITIS